MNLLARILSHGFALVVVVLIAITLMYRGDLFPESKLPDFLVIEDKSDAGTDAPAGTAEPVPSESVAVSTAAGVMAPAEPPAVEVVDVLITQDVVIQEEVIPAEEPVADDAADSDPVADSDTETGDVNAVQDAIPEESAPESVDSPQEAAEAVSPGALESTPDETRASEVQADDRADQTDQSGQVRDAQDDSSFISSAATETVSDQPEIPAPEMAVSPLASEQAVDQAPTPLAPETSPAATRGETGKSTFELLAAAREAFWLHDYEGAEKYYQQLTQADTDNPDGYGELGNMYFAQGQWEPAAAAYYEAGVRLLKTGMVVEARQMVDVIRGLNGTQADDLERQIEAAN
jgi:hypothetical protein